MKRFLLGLLFLVITVTIQAQGTKQIWLDDLDIPSFSDGIPGVSTKPVLVVNQFNWAV